MRLVWGPHSSSRAKGLDISNVLVFATDEESKELAESVGLAAYFDKRVSREETISATYTGNLWKKETMAFEIVILNR